jgi:hypothetical protein
MRKRRKDLDNEAGAHVDTVALKKVAAGTPFPDAISG